MIQFDEHIFHQGWFNHQLDDGSGFVALDPSPTEKRKSPGSGDEPKSSYTWLCVSWPRLLKTHGIPMFQKTQNPKLCIEETHLP